MKCFAYGCWILCQSLRWTDIFIEKFKVLSVCHISVQVNSSIESAEVLVFTFFAMLTIRLYYDF